MGTRPARAREEPPDQGALICGDDGRARGARLALEAESLEGAVMDRERRDGAHPAERASRARLSSQLAERCEDEAPELEPGGGIRALAAMQSHDRGVVQVNDADALAPSKDRSVPKARAAAPAPHLDPEERAYPGDREVEAPDGAKNSIPC